MPARVVRVRRRIAAPIERVFACLADHEGYTRLPGVRRARLLRPGTHERGGVGAQREIAFGPGRVVEQITALEPPRYLAYRMIASPFPIEHIGAEIRLREIASGTEIVWVSRFRPRLPFGRQLVERSVALSLTAAYGAALFFWQQMLEGDDPDWHNALPASAATNARPADQPPISARRQRRAPLSALRRRIRLPTPAATVSRLLRRAIRWPVHAAMRRKG